MDTDIAIIGAGIIGLAIASELAESDRSLFVLEKNLTHGMGISSRNSEVIHAGLYYPPKSLKAALCIEGKEIMYDVCERNNIPHKRTGKLVIATVQEELADIEDLYKNALNNGVTSVSLLDQREIKKIEPYIKAVGALHSPDTGIVSAHALMDHYLKDAKKKGAEIACGTKVIEVEEVSAGYRIATVNNKGEIFEFVSSKVINAAGLHSDSIAGMLGQEYRVHYCKGDYFSIAGTNGIVVRRLIYPAPRKDHAGLGIHLTMDLNGRMKLGPDATYIGKEEDYKVNISKKEEFYNAALKYLPFIRKEDLVPDMSGIRPKLQGPNDTFRDFIIQEDRPGFVNLIGIESPGLTAAPAIGRYVKRLMKDSGAL